MLALLFLIFFMPTNFFACYRVRYAELTEPKVKIIPFLMVKLDGFLPTLRSQQITFFQSFEHELNPKEPASLKLQAIRALLKKSPTKEQILCLPIALELKEQILTQEQLMKEYYRDLSLCVNQGLNGAYRASENDCIFDILNTFAAKEKTSFYFLERLRVIEVLRKEFFNRSFSSYGYVDHTVGEELLTKSVKSGNYQFVEWLLKFGVNPDYSNREASMVKYAVRGDRPDIIKLLIANGATLAKLDAQHNFHSESTLWSACTSGKQHCASLLLSLGADVNELNGHNFSILMATVKDGNAECAELLLQHGAEVNLKDKLGRTALFYAVDSWYSRVGCVDILIKYGAEIDARDSDLQTPLMYASRGGNLVGVKLLLQAEADVNAKDSSRENALFHVVKSGNSHVFAIVKTLREHKVDIDVRNNSGLHVVDHALEIYKDRRDSGISTAESKKVINYLLSEKPKLSLSTRLSVLYHFNRRKIWASAFCASAIVGAYLYKNKSK